MASQLSADEVAALLRKENVKEDVIKLFVNKGIDGKALLLLRSDEDFDKIGVPLGDREQLLEIISGLDKSGSEFEEVI